jgi:hypothetical protein
MNAVAVDMRRTFEDAGLLAPHVPPELEPRLRQLRDWAYSTREIAPGAMYMFDDYLNEVLTRPVEDYVAVCHAGHGANSYAITYNLVRGPLALFAQTGWGGIYEDRELTSAEVSDQLAACAALAEAVEAATPARPAPARLVVAPSPFRGIAICRWLDRPLDSEASAHAWLKKCPHDTDPLRSAIVELSRPA